MNLKSLGLFSLYCSSLLMAGFPISTSVTSLQIKARTLMSFQAIALKIPTEDHSFAMFQNIFRQTMESDPELISIVYVTPKGQLWALMERDGEQVISRVTDSDVALPSVYAWLPSLQQETERELTVNGQELLAFAAPVSTEQFGQEGIGAVLLYGYRVP